jgi:hypothetical protein
MCDVEVAYTITLYATANTTRDKKIAETVEIVSETPSLDLLGAQNQEILLAKC